MEIPENDLTGAIRPKRRRPSRDENIHRIGLREKVYNLWLANKEETGFKEKNNSE